MNSKTLFNKLLLSLLIFFSVLLSIEINQSYSMQLDAQKSYQHLAEEAGKLIDSALNAHKEQVALAGLYLSQDPKIVKALQTKNPDILDFSERFKKGAEFGSLKHAMIQLIDHDGYSIYRSWTDEVGDKIVDKRIDLQAFFKQPKVMQTISIGKYNLTNKTIVPIYKGEQFLGAFEVIGSLDSVVIDLKKSGINTLILANKNYRTQMLDQSNGRYIADRYIVNLPDNMSLIEAIKRNRMYNFIDQQAYYICEDTQWFVSFKKLMGIDGQPLAEIYLFQPLAPIQNSFSDRANVAYIYAISIYLILLMAYLGWNFRQKAAASVKDKQSLQSKVAFKNREISDQANFWQKVIDGLDDMVIIVHQKGQKAVTNQTAKKLLKFRKYNFSQCRSCMTQPNNIKDCKEHPNCPVQKSFYSGAQTREVEKLKIDGQEKFYEFTATPMVSKLHEVTQIVEVGHDITSYVTAKNQLENQKNRLDQIAHYDSLTELPNRRMFLDKLNASIALAQREHTNVALMFLDLDLFKQINDTYGHEIGDKVLILCADRLRCVLRKSDFISRLGGDEFTVIVEQIANTAAIADIVQTLLKTVSEPFVVDSMTFYLTVSVGVSLYPDDGHNMHDLLKNADTAMYQAKDSGRNSYAFYNPAMTQKAIERIELETQLRHAIENDEFEVYYQPQYHIQTHRITGFEALVRWRHPQRGLVLPQEFIPLSEENGMVKKIGEMVMRQAMNTIQEWHLKGLTTGRMAINISSKQFTDKELVGVLHRLLDETHCKPEWIELELTETSVMENQTFAADMLDEIKSLGITISIDDFGTGYSSLAQLRRMPIDKVKIDQSFILQLPHDPEDVEITKTIIAMAQNLDLEIIAEGVENLDQSNFVNNSGCLNAQGFLFSRPLPKAQIEAVLLELAVA